MDCQKRGVMATANLGVLAHLMSDEGDVMTARAVCPFPTLTPERNLLLGVLRQAFNDYLIPEADGIHRLKLQRAAAEWIFSTDDDPWSFIDDCVSLGLDYQLIRCRLQTLLSQNRRLKRRRGVNHSRS